MMRLRRAAVIAGMFLLAWAATASAECAWVLWTSHLEIRGGEITETSWAVKEASPTLSDCKKRAISEIEDLVKTLKSRGISYSVKETIVVYGDARTGHAVSSDHVCLPDTVDPRGPKAGTK